MLVFLPFMVVFIVVDTWWIPSNVGEFLPFLILVTPMVSTIWLVRPTIYRKPLFFTINWFGGFRFQCSNHPILWHRVFKPYHAIPTQSEDFSRRDRNRNMIDWYDTYLGFSYTVSVYINGEYSEHDSMSTCCTHQFIYLCRFFHDIVYLKKLIFSMAQTPHLYVTNPNNLKKSISCEW